MGTVDISASRTLSFILIHTSLGVTARPVIESPEGAVGRGAVMVKSSSELLLGWLLHPSIGGISHWDWAHYKEVTVTSSSRGEQKELIF